MDTIGDMIDKLTVVNIRIWHLIDEERELNRRLEDMPSRTKADKSARTEVLERIASAAGKVSNSNIERSSLVDQVNASLRIVSDHASGDGSHFGADLDAILGTGKNKFYFKDDSGRRK